MFSNFTKKALLLIFAFTILPQKASNGSEPFVLLAGVGVITAGVTLSKILTFDSKTKKCNQLWDGLAKKGARIEKETTVLPLMWSSRTVTSMQIIFPGETPLEELRGLNEQWEEMLKLQNRSSIEALYGILTISSIITIAGILGVVAGAQH